jgi:hypothetical protein
LIERNQYFPHISKVESKNKNQELPREFFRKYFTLKHDNS